MEGIHQVKISELKKAIIISSNQFQGQSETVLPISRGRNMKNYCQSLNFDTHLLENKEISEVNKQISEVLAKLSQKYISNYYKLLLIYYVGLSSHQSSFNYVQYRSESCHVDFSAGLGSQDNVKVIFVMDLLLSDIGQELMQFEYFERKNLHLLVIKNSKEMYQRPEVASTGQNYLQKMMKFRNFEEALKYAKICEEDSYIMQKLLISLSSDERTFSIFKQINDIKVAEVQNYREQIKKEMLKLEHLESPINQNTFCSVTHQYQLGAEFDEYQIFYYDDRYIFFHTHNRITLYRKKNQDIFQVYEEEINQDKKTPPRFSSLAFMHSKQIILIILNQRLYYLYSDNFEGECNHLQKYHAFSIEENYPYKGENKDQVFMLDLDSCATVVKMTVRIFKVKKQNNKHRKYQFSQTKHVKVLDENLLRMNMCILSCASDHQGMLYFMLKNRDNQHLSEESKVYFFSKDCDTLLLFFGGQYKATRKVKCLDLYSMSNDDIMVVQTGNFELNNVTRRRQRRMPFKPSTRAEYVNAKKEVLGYVAANNRVYLHFGQPEKSHLLFNMVYVTETIVGGPVFMDKQNLFLVVRIQNEGLFLYHMEIDEDFAKEYLD